MSPIRQISCLSRRAQLRDQLVKELPEQAGQRMSEQLRGDAARSPCCSPNWRSRRGAGTHGITADEDERTLPDWFMLEIARDLPHLAASRS